ncbi:MoaD/ThiS family protein [Marinomonas aquimarina]|uniref:MoaD/ThiS family protein n=1 Tax=Marinomonas aquimarina TaxID=295068 RepID=UPI0018D35C25|nr:MoaD/ThiS family protein [Marinomonas aquimarina]
MANLKVVFFASLRETMKCDELELPVEGTLTVRQLKEKLAEQLQQPLLLEEKVKAAIDFDFARDEDLIEPDKVREVAFFPPVTGG